MRLRLPGSLFFISSVGLLVSACAPQGSSNQMLGQEPGERGTFLALGMEVPSGDEGTLLTIGDESEEAGPITGAKKKRSASKSKRDDFVLLKSDTKGITIGTVFQGDEPLSKNESNTFIPASITKVVTSALALKTLGADFRFKTRVSWSPEGNSVARDLTVIADGDPTPRAKDDPKGAGRARIRQIVGELRKHGVRKLTGRLRLVATDDRRDVAIPTEGIDQEDNLQCYGALSQAFNYNWNCASLTIYAFEKARWSDSSLRFPYRLDMTRGERNRISATPQFDSIGRMSGVLVEGVWGTKEPRAYGISVPISNAKDWYGQELLGELAQQGIDTNGVEIVSPSGEESARILQESATKREFSFELQSDTLAELMIHMNKHSDNFLADTLFKTVAEAHDSKAEDIRRAGALAVRDAIRSWMEGDGHPEYASEIHLIDGSGLTRENRASPRAFLALLKEFSKEPGFLSLWESLPIAGTDGTLGGRMRNTKAEGMVRAKTGTVRGAYQLAGYIPKLSSSGEIVDYVPFVILSAAGAGDKTRVRTFQDKLVARLMDVVNPKFKPLAKAQ